MTHNHHATGWLSTSVGVGTGIFNFLTTHDFIISTALDLTKVLVYAMVGGFGSSVVSHFVNKALKQKKKDEN